MTRTSRSASLRSVLKDRSESKTGLNNNLRKNGGGAHNWGSLENERDLEFAGIDDGQHELDEELGDDDDSQSAHSDDLTSLKKPSSPVLERSEEEIATARKFRMNAFKGDGAGPGGHRAHLRRRLRLAPQGHPHRLGCRLQRLPYNHPINTTTTTRILFVVNPTNEKSI
ncbi:hypothetical protein B0H16DRAFT_1563077 [Mycena metata]|uniref:Hyaluronan/mRNA-binding protein domain-containing protein n=1 Tax=Mycena metata TaxID=1033252 RepID=A0AAD7IHV0_9AGAR|nr:hypothetical protein B0H16DRAFT_1563077 [Mycena metata]